ncbi:MAG: GPW/gp25 family protein [Geminicoccaceae bacterium]
MAQELFQGIHHPLAISARSGRLRQETDYEAYIRQLIRQVLLTAPGERINRPEFGAGVRRLVFAPLSPATASLAQTTIYQALTAWLDALIRVEDVRAQATLPGRLDITVTYLLRARGERRFLNVEVTE